MFDARDFIDRKQIKVVVTTGAETEINGNAKMNFIKFINQKIEDDDNLFRNPYGGGDNIDFLMNYNDTIINLSLIDTASQEKFMSQANMRTKSAHIIVHFNFDGSGKKIKPESFRYDSKSGANIIHAKGASLSDYSMDIYPQVCRIAYDKSNKHDYKKMMEEQQQQEREQRQRELERIQRELEQRQPKPSKFMQWLTDIFSKK